jgi:hypothetical protein
MEVCICFNEPPEKLCHRNFWEASEKVCATANAVVVERSQLYSLHSRTIAGAVLQNIDTKVCQGALLRAGLEIWKSQLLW